MFSQFLDSTYTVGDFTHTLFAYSNSCSCSWVGTVTIRQNMIQNLLSVSSNIQRRPKSLKESPNLIRIKMGDFFQIRIF